MPGGSGVLVDGRYLLLDLVGEGGMGRVWRGRDQLLDREVAIKEVRLPYHSDDKERAELVARSTREARAAARLNHPGAVTIHDVVEMDGTPWIVMEFIRGSSLGAEITRSGRLPWSRVAQIGKQVSDVLAHAHAAGIVHRDVKPDNILLQGERAVLTDFGIARVLDSTTNLTGPGVAVGTIAYMAPELLEGSSAGPPADMWALGATLYAAVQGAPPFVGPTMAAVVAGIIAQSPAPAGHAGPLGELLQALLSKDPAKRPVASAVVQELTSGRSIRHAESVSTAADTPTAASPPIPPIPPKRPVLGGASEYPRDDPWGDGFSDGSTQAVLADTVPQLIPDAVLIDPDAITTRAQFVQSLQAVKDHANLTAKEVATVIGVPVSTVRGYFDRDRLPAERDRLRQILHACGVPPGDLPRWEGALVRVRSQRLQTARARQRRSRSTSRENRRLFVFGPSDEPPGDSTNDGTDDADLLFRVYIPKSQLYAEQRREMLRLFRVWLTTVQGQDVKQQDFSTKNGDTVAFYVGPGQPRPALGEEYREFVSFVEYSANNPTTAIDRLTEIGLDESTGTELVTDYAMKFHRMEMGLRHARQNRILSLQQTLEGQLLDKGGDPQGIAAIQSVQIRSLLDRVVPPPTAAPSLPAIAAPDLRHPPSQVNMTFNAEQIIYTAIDNNIQGTANFGPEAIQLLSLINEHADRTQAGSLLTALHELEDPGIPTKERSTAKKKLTAFLADLAKRVPGVGVDILEAYLKWKLGLPGS